MKLSIWITMSCLVLAGCSSPAPEESVNRDHAMTTEERIQEIEARTDMPDDVKQQAIQSLRQSQPPQQDSPGAK